MQDPKTAAFSVFRFTGLLFGIAWLAWMNYFNQLPVDAGDGILHYSIARQSWKESFYFLDHWGKPLFTLLSSGFAQPGFRSYVVFNLLVFTATSLFAFGIFRQLKAGWAYYFLFPLLLLCIPDYTYCTLAGMTEPLFGLLLTAAVFFAFRQRWIVFAGIVSFMPFARSEGMLVVAAAFALLAVLAVLQFIEERRETAPADHSAFIRKCVAVPMLTLGFVVYAIAGKLLIGMPWWYFQNDPYPETSIYGFGPWYHYLSTWRNHFGIITLALLLFGLFGCFVLWKKKLVPHFGWIALFGIGSYLGIVFTHSYLWAYGLKGAGGLTRLATQGIPVLLLFILVGCHFVTRELNAIPHIVFGTLTGLLIVKELRELPYPLKANPLEAILIESADYAQAHYPGKKIYYFHPLIPWRLNVGMKDTDPRFEQRYFSEEVPSTITNMQPGAILIRDPQFGPVEQGLPLRFVEAYRSKLVPVKVFRTKTPYSVHSGEPAEVVIYEVAP